MDPIRLLTTINNAQKKNINLKYISDNIPLSSLNTCKGIDSTNNIKIIKDDDRNDKFYDNLLSDLFKYKSSIMMANIDTLFAITGFFAGPWGPQTLDINTSLIINPDDIGIIKYLQYRNPLYNCIIMPKKNMQLTDIMQDNNTMFILNINDSKLPLDICIIENYNTLKNIIDYLIFILMRLKINGKLIIKINISNDNLLFFVDLLTILKYCFKNLILTKLSTMNVYNNDFYIVGTDFFNLNVNKCLSLFRLSNKFDKLLADTDFNILNYILMIIDDVNKFKAKDKSYTYSLSTLLKILNIY